MEDPLVGSANRKLTHYQDCIRKAANRPPAIILVDDRVQVRRAADCFNAGIHASQELLTQAGAAGLVPGVGVCEVLFGLGSYDQLSGHSGCEPFV
jgi:hypothetical protein